MFSQHSLQFTAINEKLSLGLVSTPNHCLTAMFNELIRFWPPGVCFRRTGQTHISNVYD